MDGSDEYTSANSDSEHFEDASSTLSEGGGAARGPELKADDKCVSSDKAHDALLTCSQVSTPGEEAGLKEEDNGVSSKTDDDDDALLICPPPCTQESGDVVGVALKEDKMDGSDIEDAALFGQGTEAAADLKEDNNILGIEDAALLTYPQTSTSESGAEVGEELKEEDKGDSSDIEDDALFGQGTEAATGLKEEDNSSGIEDDALFGQGTESPAPQNCKGRESPESNVVGDVMFWPGRSSSEMESFYEVKHQEVTEYPEDTANEHDTDGIGVLTKEKSVDSTDSFEVLSQSSSCDAPSEQSDSTEEKRSVKGLKAIFEGKKEETTKIQAVSSKENFPKSSEHDHALKKEPPIEFEETASVEYSDNLEKDKVIHIPHQGETSGDYEPMEQETDTTANRKVMTDVEVLPDQSDPTKYQLQNVTTLSTGDDQIHDVQTQDMQTSMDEEKEEVKSTKERTILEEMANSDQRSSKQDQVTLPQTTDGSNEHEFITPVGEQTQKEDCHNGEKQDQPDPFHELSKEQSSEDNDGQSGTGATTGLDESNDDKDELETDSPPVHNKDQEDVTPVLPKQSETNASHQHHSGAQDSQSMSGYSPDDHEPSQSGHVFQQYLFHPGPSGQTNPPQNPTHQLPGYHGPHQEQYEGVPAIGHGEFLHQGQHTIEENTHDQGVAGRSDIGGLPGQGHHPDIFVTGVGNVHEQGHQDFNSARGQSHPNFGDVPGQGHPNFRGIPGQGHPYIGVPGQGHSDNRGIPGQRLPDNRGVSGQGHPDNRGVSGQGHPNVRGIPGQGYPDIGVHLRGHQHFEEAPGQDDSDNRGVPGHGHQGFGEAPGHGHRDRGVTGQCYPNFGKAPEQHHPGFGQDYQDNRGVPGEGHPDNRGVPEQGHPDNKGVPGQDHSDFRGAPGHGLQNIGGYSGQGRQGIEGSYGYQHGNHSYSDGYQQGSTPMKLGQHGYQPQWSYHPQQYNYQYQGHQQNFRFPPQQQYYHNQQQASYQYYYQQQQFQQQQQQQLRTRNLQDKSGQRQPHGGEERQQSSEKDNSKEVPEETHVIEVRGFSSSMKLDTLELYFENKKSNGGAVKSKVIRKGAAYITFEEIGVAQRVASKTDHVLNDTKLTVKLHQQPPPNTIAVKSQTNKDTIEMYFESKSKSGGGDCTIKEENGFLYFTFEDSAVFERVLQRCPHKLSGKTLQVSKAGEEELGEEDEDEITPSATLEVRGYDIKSSLESISLYFENKRKSGGGGEVAVKLDKKKGVIYVTFESNEIAERVLKRDHKLEGKELTVTLSRPQVMYKDKMLVTGVPEDVSKDSLVIYLENVTRFDADNDSVLYGEEDEVLVSFKEDLRDFSVIIDKMKKKPFKQDKRRIDLEVSQVAMTTCIRVNNLPTNASEDTLRYYFQNKKSGGTEGEVKDIVMNHQDGFAVVEFATPEVASAVAKRKHVICKTTVPVSLHFECLGESGGSADPKPTKLPPLLELDLDLHKLKHVKVTEKVSENLQVCFESTPANFTIDIESSKLTLSPDFSLDFPDGKRLVKTWSKNVKERCITFFEKIEIEKLRVDPDVWSDSEEITGRIHEQGISIFRLDEKKTIVLVGPRNNIQRLKDNLEEELKSLKKQYEREKSRVTEEQCYSIAKLHLLQSEGFLDRIKFNDLKVDVVEPGKISFTGQSADIQRAKIELLQRLGNIPSTVSRDFSKEEVELLKCTQVSKYLETKWNQSSNRAMWEIGQGGVIIVYIHQDDYEAVLQFLQNSFKKITMNLDTNNSSFLKSSKLQTAIESISRDHEGKVVITVEASEMRIVITGLKQDVVSAEADVRDFVDRNSICSQQYTCSDDYKLRYLKLHCQKQIEAIEKETVDFEIEFIWEDTSHSICLQIRSSKLGYQHARQKLEEIIQNIQIFPKELNKTGMKTFLKDRNVLKNVEKGTNCIISLEEGKPEETRDAGAMFDVSQESDFGIMFTCQAGSGKLHVGVGSILDVGSSVEGMVVEVTSNLSPDSKQARDTMRRAGPSVESELKQRFRHSNFTEGEVISTCSGQLKCKKIICAIGPSGVAESRQAMENVISECLDEAVKKGLTSVALPVFNTSYMMQLGPEVAVEPIIQAVHDFFQRQDDSLEEVYLCLEDPSQYTITLSVAMDVFGQECITSESGEETTRSLHGGLRTSLSHRNETPRRSTVLRTEPEKPRSATAHMPRPRIILVKADMGVEEADVIVNSSNPKLQLNQGQVSKALLKNAGPAIQRECQEKYPQGIAMGDVAVTKGGNMQCVEQIYHCTLPQWRDDTGKETFSKTMAKLLKKTNDAKWKTIAIPALGTGTLGYSRPLVAKLMYESVAKFRKDTDNITINDVLFIVYPGDQQTITAFEAEDKKYRGATGGRVPATQKEMEDARRDELYSYRATQGYSDKFGDPTPVRRHQPPVPPVATPSRMSKANKSTSKLPRNLPKKSHIPICVYSDDGGNAIQAVNEIYSKLDKALKKRVIGVDAIGEWPQEQIDKIAVIEQKFDVEIRVDKSKGELTLNGLPSSGADAYEDVYKIIREIENWNKIAHVVQWFYVDITGVDDKRVEYEKKVNAELETAFRTDGKKRHIYCGYVFDFESMEEYPVKDSTDRVKIIRRDRVLDAHLDSMPATWDSMAHEKDVLVKQITNDSIEFTNVNQQFQDALGTMQATMTRLDRIQSKTLYWQYQAKKSLLEKRNQGGNVERTLWHGTKVDATMSICTHGFNRGYCDSKSVLGEGVYFTIDAGYAARDRYAAAADNKNRHMFMCKVLTGEYTAGSQGIRVPPLKDPNNHNSQYDSVVDDVNNPKTFVIFHDSQAYPEYLISFQ